MEISTLLCKALDHVRVGLLVVFTGLPVRSLDNRSRQLNLWPGSRCVGLLGCSGDLGEHPSEGQGLTPVGGPWLGGGWLLKSVGGTLWTAKPRLAMGGGGRLGAREWPSCVSTPALCSQLLLHNKAAVSNCQMFTLPTHSPGIVACAGTRHGVELLYFIYYYFKKRHQNSMPGKEPSWPGAECGNIPSLFCAQNYFCFL